MPVKRPRGPTAVLRDYLPDFCWQTTHEILRMLEYADIEAGMSYESVKVEISKYVKKGFIFRREIKKFVIPPVRKTPETTQMPPRYEYIRNPNWKSKKCLRNH